MWKHSLQISNLLIGDIDSIYKLLDRSNTAEYYILSSKGIFSEEYLKGCLLIVFVVHEVRIRTRELIKITDEDR